MARDVDTDALEGVAGFLGIGNPSTVRRNVVFDDDTLVQSLNVERIVGLPGIRIRKEVRVVALATATEYADLSIVTLIQNNPGLGVVELLVEEGINPSQCDVWLEGVQSWVDAATSANLSLHLAGFTRTGPDETDVDDGLGWVYANQNAVLPIQLSAGRSTYPLNNSLEENQRHPALIHSPRRQMNGILRATTTAGAGGAVSTFTVFSLVIVRQGYLYASPSV